MKPRIDHEETKAITDNDNQLYLLTEYLTRKERKKRLEERAKINEIEFTDKGKQC